MVYKIVLKMCLSVLCLAIVIKFISGKSGHITDTYIYIQVKKV